MFMRSGVGARALMAAARIVLGGLVVLGGLAGGPGTARAQGTDLENLLERIVRLERDIRTLNVSIARGQAPAPLVSGAGSGPGNPADGEVEGGPAVARLGNRITALEDLVRTLTGHFETVNHRIDEVGERLDKLVGDVDFRLSALEKPSGAAALAGGPGPMAPPPLASGSGTLGTLSGRDLALAEPADGGGRAAPPVVDGGGEPMLSAGAVLPSGSTQDQYAYAFGLLRKADYDRAETALKAFIDTHPDDPLAGNARYWLGEAYYVRGDYVQAAEVFLTGYQKAPKGAKAPDTLLKLGMSLSNLDKKREACAAFTKLTNDFPDLPGNVASLVGRERQRNDCR